MKNGYEIRGEITAIFLKRRDGSLVETIIDTNDLNVMESFPFTWYSYWSTGTKSYYAVGNIKTEKGKQRTIRLHRWIMNPESGYMVDHINHNTLDNRKENLRIVTNAENQQNREGKRRDNNSSKYRGVSWNKRECKWKAHMKLNGKYVHLGTFDNEEEAYQASLKARTEFMPFSKERELMKDDSN